MSMLTYFGKMKYFRGYCWLGLLGLSSLSTHAQSLAGIWQGVEDPEAERYYPAVMRLRRGQGESLFGILYQEVGPRPNITVTFEMKGVRTATGMKLNHISKLNETGQSPFSYWCDGSITFTYDAAQEKLTGHAIYDPVGSCDTGEFIFYRVKLKSPPSVKAGVLNTLRVSGRDVRWYTDPACKQLVASGNNYPTKLSKTTTFYIKQGFFPSAESQAVPITITVTGAAKTQPAIAAQTDPIAAPLAPHSAQVQTPIATSPTKLPSVLPSGSGPLILSSVLFKQGTAILLPGSNGMLDKIAAELKTQPTVRLRIMGHTDHLGDSVKNQVLSEQRAAAVKAYLVKAGVAADRLETAGFGDTRLLYTAPDQRNRRVEIERL